MSDLHFLQHKKEMFGSLTHHRHHLNIKQQKFSLFCYVHTAQQYNYNDRETFFFLPLPVPIAMKISRTYLIQWGEANWDHKRREPIREWTNSPQCSQALRNQVPLLQIPSLLFGFTRFREQAFFFFFGGGVDLNKEHKLKASQNSGIWTCAVSLNPYELKKPIIHIRVKESM